ncbi:exocyst complex component EXO84B-like isoform X2 [Senna tora]|uniref:Exocyst complex component EXO84B-like isoform X2 n=1 Tax=Senna tora TaxID=362788 RepID=A0A834TC85_9FABA|nr:exocyst complex component EXO84B-like isoform X2 [Senna tora]
MEPSKFYFRDHHDFRNSMYSQHISNVITSVSSDPDSAIDIESMTGRGIKHLCSELLELKAASSEGLQKNIFANYSVFIRMLEEARGVEYEFVQLEKHFATHKKLVKELKDGIYPKLLSEETINSTFEDHIDTVPSAPGELEVHIDGVMEKLDVVLAENRIDEALDLLESADEFYRSIEDYSSDSETMLYGSLISERKSMFIQQLTQIVEYQKIAIPELQKALAGLCRLGDNQLAVRLLLKYYHSRIQTGIYNLQWSKSSSSEIYTRELAKFVFSVISQAASGFVILCGETSPHASELMVWSYEETKSLVTCLDKYIKSISEIRGRCLVSGIFGGESSSLAVGQLPEYCMLTNSDVLELLHSTRSLITCLHLPLAVFNQAIIEDISPLVALQMGGLVVSGLMNLFTQYNVILERALTSETSVTEKGSPRIKLAESLPQQVSVLANLSTIVQFLSIIVKSIFRGISYSDSHLMGNHSVVPQKELDDFLLFIGEGYDKLLYNFCQNFILNLMSNHSSHEFTPVIHNNDNCDANTIHSLIPSSVFQIFFLELRKLEQLSEEKVFEVDWLMDFLRELMEGMLIWVCNNKETYATGGDNMSSEPEHSKQFLLDVQFLVEIGMYGGYFSDDPLLLLTLMKSAFRSAGLDPFRDADKDGWAIDIASTTIRKLLEIENLSTIAGKNSQKDDISSSQNGTDAEEVVIEKDETEDAIEAEEFNPQEGSLDLLEYKKDYVEKGTQNITQTIIQLENTEFVNAAAAEHDETQIADPNIFHG